MDWTVDTLPNETETLKALVLEQPMIDARLETEKQSLQDQIHSHNEQLHLLLHLHHGPRSKQPAPGQCDLFNEAEAATAWTQHIDCLIIELRRTVRVSLAWARITSAA